MSLSAEAIIAIVTLLVTCPPALFVVWKIYLRHKRRQECYSRCLWNIIILLLLLLLLPSPRD